MSFLYLDKGTVSDGFEIFKKCVKGHRSWVYSNFHSILSDSRLPCHMINQLPHATAAVVSASSSVMLVLTWWTVPLP